MHKPSKKNPGRQRRALSNVGGRLEIHGGSAAQRQALEHALRVDADERVVMAHVHGFHSYPARLHPQTAARLIEAFSPSTGHVLDPFCGSGTVLVEARRLGRNATGVDANPLAVELSWLKTGGLGDEQIAELEPSAHAVAEHAEARRKRKAGPTRPYGQVDRSLFSVHVLLELDGLRDGIRTIRPAPVQRALALVLSSLLTKVSLRTGDTTEELTPRRLAAGHTARLFFRKTEELARRLRDFHAQVRPGVPLPTVELGDARSLACLGPSSVDLVVTSPPYPGNYDYYQQHAPRLRWLGLDGRSFEQREIGSRRRLGGRGHGAALGDWERDLGACLGEMRRVLRPQGVAVLVLGDAVLGGRAVRGDETAARLGAERGLEPLARACQPRPNFHLPSASAFASRPRAEHVLLLGPPL
jgi:SAM-dependent methyltransferase